MNIAKFSPFIEEDGRRNNSSERSNETFETQLQCKTTITVDSKTFVQFLLEKSHRDNLHDGTEYVRNMLQQKYWIIGLRKAGKSGPDVSNADPETPTLNRPSMADLPRERLDEHVSPFTHTGVN